MYITDENADKAVAMLNTEMGKILAMPELNKDTLCALGELVDILKDLKEIDKDAYEEGSSYGSYAGGYGNSNRGSYAGGGYSQRYNSYNNYNGYSSRRGRRSMDSERDHIMSKMEQFMSQATNENERELVRRIMDSI